MHISKDSFALKRKRPMGWDSLSFFAKCCHTIVQYIRPMSKWKNCSRFNEYLKFLWAYTN